MLPSIPESLQRELSGLVTAQMGLHYPPDRWADLERGLRSAAAELGIVDLASWCDYLVKSGLPPQEIPLLARHLTIGETYFWRESPTMETLENSVLPEWLASRSPGCLKIWSAGCCTGEEAYSLAILAHRALRGRVGWDISILATDVNTHFLEKAAQGIYREWSFRNTPNWLKEQYFTRTPDGFYQIRSEIRQIVQFSVLNLVQDPYPSQSNNTCDLDVIFCRNVLMYFSAEHVRRALNGFYLSLVNAGIAVIGVNETLNLQNSYFANQGQTGPILRKGTGKGEGISEGNGRTGPRAQRAPANSGGIDCRPLTPNSGGIDCRPLAPNHTMKQAPGERQAPDHTGLMILPGSNKEDEHGAAPPEGYVFPNVPLGGLTAETDGPSTGHPAETDDFPEGRPAETEVAPSPVLRAHQLANAGQPGEALEWCERAIAVNRLDGEAYYVRATILQELGEIPQALDTFRKALYLEPDLVLAHFAMGSLQLQQGNTTEADRHFRNARLILGRHPSDDILPHSNGMRAEELSQIIDRIVGRL